MRRMLRIINWNISFQGDTKQKLVLLKAVINEVDGPDTDFIIALQEVTEKAYSVIIEEGIFHYHCYSLNYRSPGPLEGRSRGLGCLIACSGNLQINESSLIERMPFPERALLARFSHNGIVFETLCFHSLTGVGFLKAKSAQLAALAEYLCFKREEPIILCCDLNEPKIDHIDQNKIEFFDQRGDQGKAAGYILRPEGKHLLQDSYRLWLSKNEQLLAQVTKEQQRTDELFSTPLAVSHMVAGKIKKRYDYILVTPHWQVKNVTYCYEEAVKHGSDHAIVMAELEWGKSCK